MKKRTATTPYGETVTLPKYVYIDGNAYIFRRYNKITKRCPAKTIGHISEDFGSVLEIYKEMIDQTSQVSSDWPEKLFRNVVRNARPRKILVQITKEQIQEMMERCDGRCSVSGIAFDDTKIEGKRIRPWVPSVDRIDPDGPYTMDNCRLVCAAVNYAMNEFGDDVLLKIVRMYSIKLRREGRLA